MSKLNPIRRKDFAEMDTRGEINETAAAKLLNKSQNTLAAWRRKGFPGLPFAPTVRQVHGRLVAYLRADVERLASALAASVAA